VTYTYRLFGLRVLSEIELPELALHELTGSADVTIRLAEVEDVAESEGLKVAGDELLFAVDGIARYRIGGGREIVVDPAPGVPVRNIRLFLLGSAFGALLHQRGILPLHANAIDLGGNAVAFMGMSGSGKSTLAAWFHDIGYPILTDDVCAVSFGANERPYVAPGLPRLRLWREAVEATHRDPACYQRSYTSDAPHEKFDIPLARIAEAEVPLAIVYVLQQGDTLDIAELTGVEAAQALFENTYRGGFLRSTGTADKHWFSIVQLLRCVRVFNFVRPWSLNHLDDDSEMILSHAGTVGLVSSCQQPCA